MVLGRIEAALMYPAPDPTLGDWQAPHWLACEDVHFQSADGTALHGWFSPNDGAPSSILFCHGNGEHVAYLADDIEFFRENFGASVFVFDYRGYGKSSGRPHEQGILEDGEAARRWLTEKTGHDATRQIVWGRSLGGAVAVHLAATGGAQCLVLDRTFSCMVAVARSLFPWLPVGWLLRNRYPSHQRIADYHGPVIQVHGKPDSVVPFHLGQELFDAAPGLKKRLLISEVLSHNELWPEEIVAAVRQFVLEAVHYNSNGSSAC